MFHKYDKDLFTCQKLYVFFLENCFPRYSKVKFDFLQNCRAIRFTGFTYSFEFFLHI